MKLLKTWVAALCLHPSPKPVPYTNGDFRMNIGFKKLVVLAALAVSSVGATAAPTLLGLYLLDGNGNKAAGSGPNLTAEGNGAVSYVAGLSGQAASFNGTGANWLRAAVNSSGNTNPTFSWGAWVKLTNPSAWNIFLSNDDGGWDRFTQANNGRWSVSHNGVVNSSAATSTDWTFVAQSFDGTNQMLYVNGALVLTTADSPNSSQTFIDIGRNANSAFPLNGLMDSVFLFDDALAADQMLTAYSGGAGGNGVLQVAGLANQGGTVPEPQTLALALIALTGLALSRRRSNQK